MVHTKRGLQERSVTLVSVLCECYVLTVLPTVAALTMYQRARKLANVISNSPTQFLNLAELQLEALLVSINALSLIDPKAAWFVLPLSAENGNEVRICYMAACLYPNIAFSHVRGGNLQGIYLRTSTLWASGMPKSLN